MIRPGSMHVFTNPHRHLISNKRMERKGPGLLKVDLVFHFFFLSMDLYLYLTRRKPVDLAHGVPEPRGNARLSRVCLYAVTGIVRLVHGTPRRVVAHARRAIRVAHARNAALYSFFPSGSRPATAGRGLGALASVFVPRSSTFKFVSSMAVPVSPGMYIHWDMACLFGGVPGPAALSKASSRAPSLKFSPDSTSLLRAARPPLGIIYIHPAARVVICWSAFFRRVS